VKDGKIHVVIAGGGVAALEAAIALGEVAGDLVEVELLSPDEHFSYRPLAVALPFDETEAVRFQLSELVGRLGASVTRAALTGVDAWRRLAHTSANRDIEYDVLLIACGTVPRPSIEGALTFRGPVDADLVREVLDEIARKKVRSLALVVPWGPAWPLPAYELALLARSHVASGVELWVVTPEAEPLQLFGPAASEAVRDLLARHGVGLRTGAYCTHFEDGRLELQPGGTLDVERVITLPRLGGAPIDGVPQTLDGFIPVDDHGRVHGLPDVYAAGDITSFPIKHGGLATQQANAAAEMIAANAGADIEPRPFRPVLHGLLLTGSEPRFLRRELHGTAESEPVATREALWWPPAKIAGRHLGPFLAALVGEAEPRLDLPDGAAVPIDVPVERETLERANIGRIWTSDSPEDDASVGDVSSLDVCLVAPEDTLGEVAEHMLQQDVSAALVSEYGRLIGILTTSDLMSAFAARANPGDARARQWMTAEPITLDATASRTEAARLMRAYGVHHLPLLADGRPAALFHLDTEPSPTLPIGLGF